MYRKLAAQILKPFGQIRQNEVATAFLMFLYSFLMMAAYNVIKPATRSKFIESLGPDNLPYVQLAAGVLVGFIMAVYSWLMVHVSRRVCVALAQGVVAAVLLVFWLLFRTNQAWVSAAFYLLGLILGILLISQFWTFANVVFDPRQAKRLFGFVGGGSSLGGILGSFLAKTFVEQIATENLILISVGFMLLGIFASGLVVHREGTREEMQGAQAGAEKGIGNKEAIELLRKSKHLRLIALVISFAVIGAAIIEQQLNMAATAAHGQQSTDAITAFLANVQLWTSVIGFVIQVMLTSRIQQNLGIGFALLLLPISLGSSAVIMLFNAALWAPSVARIMDQSLRYTVDKTTREILYMPLPADTKFAAKPFVDVTVDRFAKGLASVLLLFLIKPWGLNLAWQRLSYASVIITGVWIFVALRASRGYNEAFRTSIDTREIKPADVATAKADLPTIETLIQELASTDEQRVLFAIEFLELLEKKQLITPLLLYHESPAVRARALSVIRLIQPEFSNRWLPAVQGMLSDPDPNVRSEAIGALASMHNRQAIDIMRPLLRDENPRISLTAAMMLAGSGLEEDAAKAENVLSGIVSDTRESAAPLRRDLAISVRHVPIPHFRRLLIPLLNDPNPEVAEEAMLSTRKLGPTDMIFVPTLISLLRNRRQKSRAREMLVGFGESVLPILFHFLRDPDEDIWIRRHIPATIARIPCQKAVDILVEALDEKDGFLRFHVIAALERIHRVKPELAFSRHRIELLIQDESSRHIQYRRMHWILFESQQYPRESLLSRALTEKMERGLDRIYRLLSLLHPWKEIAAARHIIEHGSIWSRAATLEYLDTLLTSGLRKTLIPLLEGMPFEDGWPSLHGTDSDAEAVVIRLIDDDDPVIASAAIYFVRYQGFSNLLKEVERILAREPKDRYVRETALWALQEWPMPIPTRRLIWLEPLPFVDLANQMRSLPLFGSVTVDEIFRICAAGQKVWCEPGRLLCKENTIPESVQFLLNGRVSVTRPGRETRIIKAPAVLAFQEVLENRPMTESVRTIDMSVCLTLTTEEIQALLSDNSDFVSGLFRMLCGDSQTRRVVVKGHQSMRRASPAGGELNPVEKGLILKTIPLFSQVSSDEIIPLASVATEIQLTAGADLFVETDRPSIHAIVSGELSIEGIDGSPFIIGSSDVIGIYETLAGIDFDFRARIKQSGIALRIDREDLFDLLVQRSALLRQVLSALFRNQPASSAAAG